MRNTEKKRRRRLRVEYRRNQGRHDRCWDTVTEGRYGIRNVFREAVLNMNREFWRSMAFRIWKETKMTEYHVEYCGPGKGYR